MESVFLIFLVVYVVICVFTFLVPCCDVPYDFRIKTKFCSSLPPVVRRMAYVLFVLYVVVYVRCVVFLLCFSSFCRFVYPMLPVSLDCPFLIASSVFTDIYLEDKRNNTKQSNSEI